MRSPFLAKAIGIVLFLVFIYNFPHAIPVFVNAIAHLLTPLLHNAASVAKDTLVAVK